MDKVELSVRPNGLTSAYSKPYPGSVSDIDIMTERVALHRTRLRKPKDDNTISKMRMSSMRSIRTRELFCVIKGTKIAAKCLAESHRKRKGNV